MKKIILIKHGCLRYILIPFYSSRAVMASELNEEILCSKERFQFHLNRDVLSLGILVDALEVVVLNKFARAFVITQKIMDSLL